jgi:hypothetical protein
VPFTAKSDDSALKRTPNFEERVNLRPIALTVRFRFLFAVVRKWDMLPNSSFIVMLESDPAKC